MEGERDRLMLGLELSTTRPGKPRDVGFVISLSLGREKIAELLIVELSVGVTIELSSIRGEESGGSATVLVIPKSGSLGENCLMGPVGVGSPDREAALPLPNSS